MGSTCATLSKQSSLSPPISSFKQSGFRFLTALRSSRVHQLDGRLNSVGTERKGTTKERQTNEGLGIQEKERKTRKEKLRRTRERGVR